MQSRRQVVCTSAIRVCNAFVFVTLWYYVKTT